MRNSLRVGTAALTLLAALAASRGALAATYQVGAGKPYADLAAVAPLLAPGDLVELDGDATYAGGVKLTQSGTSSQKITIRGIRVNGKRPVITGGVSTVEVYANHYVLEGLDLTGGSSRCFFHHGDDVTLRDAVVHDCPGHGVLGADSESGSLTMEYVEVYAAGAGDTKHPVYIATDEETYPGSVFRMQHCWVHDGNGGNNVKTRAERNEIYYNWIEGALYHELEMIGPDGQDPALAREDSDVVGNVFRKTSTSFVTRIGGDGTGDTNGRYRFVNNTFVLVPGSASVFRLFDGVESVEMHNNVFFRIGGGGVKIIQDADVSWTTGTAVIAGTDNWVPDASEAVPAAWSGTIVGTDPSFVDAGGNDFHPLSGSALVDAAASAPSGPAGFPFPSPLALPMFLPPPNAIEAVDGAVPRPVVAAMDIGAYEFGVIASTSSSGAGGGGTSSAATSGAGSTSGAGGTSTGGETTSTGTTGSGGDDGAGASGSDGDGGGASAPEQPGEPTSGAGGVGFVSADATEDGGAAAGCSLGPCDRRPPTAAFLAAAALVLAWPRRRRRVIRG